jgi:hypothetical protein
MRKGKSKPALTQGETVNVGPVAPEFSGTRSYSKPERSGEWTENKTESLPAPQLDRSRFNNA